MKSEDEDESAKAISRRTALTIGAAAAAVPLLPPSAAIAQSTVNPSPQNQGAETMTFVTTKDGTQIFYKDYRPKNAQPLVCRLAR
jgi:non-heme chloroperoxidase